MFRVSPTHPTGFKEQGTRNKEQGPARPRRSGWEGAFHIFNSEFGTVVGRSARPSPHGATRGYSRPPAAVTSRHQRVASGRVTPRHIPPGPGHNRCRRQVATLAFGYHMSVPGTGPCVRNALKHGTTDHRALLGWVGGICNLQSAICNLQFVMGGWVKFGIQNSKWQGRLPTPRPDREAGSSTAGASTPIAPGAGESAARWRRSRWPSTR